jgi:glucose/arabinose dehydrogenase
VIGAVLAGCLALHSSGGGEIRQPAGRDVDATDVVAPNGYTVSVVAEGLAFPTAVAFDEAGAVYVVEAGYSYGEVFSVPRVVRLGESGPESVISGTNGPWTGAAFHDGRLYVAEGGEERGGRIVRYEADGSGGTAIVEGLPSLGDHHTDGVVFGPDGDLYFGEGTATNSGVVGPDNMDFGWLGRHPEFHDVPCADVTLSGIDYASEDVVGHGERVRTGPFLPFGTPATAGMVIPGNPRCNGAILKVSADGGEPSVVAWGFRNPYGLAFGPDGALYTAVNGYDDRGSRPVFGAGDWLYRVTPGAWYGWPDHADGNSLTEPRYRAPGGPALEPLLDPEPGVPPPPLAVFPVHSSADGMAVAPAAFGHAGELFVALFGDMAPGVGNTGNPVGYDVVRVDPVTGVIEEFLANRGPKTGPASWSGGRGLERPVSVAFGPDGALYVVDFGVLTVDEHGPRPLPDTGVIWRVSR